VLRARIGRFARGFIVIARRAAGLRLATVLRATVFFATGFFFATVLRATVFFATGFFLATVLRATIFFAAGLRTVGFRLAVVVTRVRVVVLRAVDRLLVVVRGLRTVLGFFRATVFVAISWLLALLQPGRPVAQAV
jgi:hypothetical protein